MPRSSLGTWPHPYPARVTDAGLVPWAESGMSIVRRMRALRLVIRPHDQEAGQFAGRSRRRLEGCPGHAGEAAQDVLGLEEHRQGPLGEAGRGRRVEVAEAGCSAAQSHTLGLYFMVHDPSG